MAESYQQHEIPTVSVTVTQYDQHRVRCGCARVQTAARPEGAWSGPVGYGPNLQAFTVSLMVVHVVPAHRCVAVLESLTGAAPRVGFGHGMLERTAALLSGVTRRIRALITGAPAVCCDETPIKVGPSKPQPGTKKAERYLLLACTERFTHSLLGDRSMQTFTTSVVAELTDSVIVHDRYQNYDSTALGELTHQLCCQHLLRDLVGAGEAYPDAHWPNQIADALRSLIHQANLARDHHQAAIDTTTTTDLIDRFRSGGRVGLCDTLGPPDRPGQRKARLLLDVLRDRYTIRGYLSTAATHHHNMINALHHTMHGRPWTPPHPHPT